MIYLVSKLVADNPADCLRGVASSADATRVGHKDEARTVDLNFLQHCRVLACRDEEAVIHIFPDREGQHIARCDCIRPERRGVAEAGIILAGPAVVGSGDLR